LKKGLGGKPISLLAGFTDTDTFILRVFRDFWAFPEISFLSLTNYEHMLIIPTKGAIFVGKA
jgi:hypothetical protein